MFKDATRLVAHFIDVPYMYSCISSVIVSEDDSMGILSVISFNLVVDLLDKSIDSGDSSPGRERIGEYFL